MNSLGEALAASHSLNIVIEAFMVLEAVTLRIRPGQSGDFESTFKQAQAILTSMAGYVAHELQRCLETEDRYLLLVRWQAIEDHTIGFRNHPDFAEWKRLLHHFYDPPPTIQHYELVIGAGRT